MMQESWLLGLGFVGQAMFAGRFGVQWWVSERQGRSVVPRMFWVLSVAGGTLMLGYAVLRRDPVFILHPQPHSDPAFITDKPSLGRPLSSRFAAAAGNRPWGMGEVWSARSREKGRRSRPTRWLAFSRHPGGSGFDSPGDGADNEGPQLRMIINS